jgi:tetratricopeptide (TPR) repeat protein
MQKLPITVCMIVKDEEEFLTHSLESVKHFASEIIVVDTGSLDASRDIALNAGAQVVDHTWEDSFSRARNVSLALATQEWTLVLDGDELLDQKSVAALTSSLKETPLNAFYLNRRHYLTHLNSNCMHQVEEPLPLQGFNPKGYQLTEDVRLFRSGLFTYQGRVHEQLEESIWGQGFTIGRCPGLIHHFSAFKSNGKAHKHGRYLELAQADYKEKPDNWKNLLQLVSELEVNGFAQEAHELLTAEGANFQTNYAVLRVWGLSCIQFGKLSKALELLKTAVEQNTNDLHSWSGLGLCLLRLGHAEAALKCYTVCRDLGVRDPNISINMGLAALISGDKGTANAHFDEAYQLHPDFEPARVCVQFLASLHSGTSLSPSDRKVLTQLLGSKAVSLVLQ